MKEPLTKRATMTVIAVVLLALGSWALLGASPEGPAVPADLVAPAPAPLGPSSAVPGPDAGCDGPAPLLLPEGVEAGPRQACCLDECRTDFDCFFRCGGQPGKCTMPNPCCTVCQCVVSSFTLAS